MYWDYYWDVYYDYYGYDTYDDYYYDTYYDYYGNDTYDFYYDDFYFDNSYANYSSNYSTEAEEPFFFYALTEDSELDNLVTMTMDDYALYTEFIMAFYFE